MGTIAALLDKARARRSIASDMALAEVVGVSRSVVSEWRKGTKVPSEDHVCALAKMAHEDIGRWLMIAQAARTTGPAHAAWVGLLRQYGIAAVVALAAVLPLSGQAAPAQAERADGVGIMRSSV